MQKDKKAYLPSSQCFMSQFNNIVKNNNNNKLEKINEQLNNDDTSFDLSESSCEDNNDNSLESLYDNNIIAKPKKKKESTKMLLSSGKKSKNRKSVSDIAEILEKKRKKYHFLKPFTNIKDEKCSYYLKKDGYDIENILILTNKNNFQSFIDDLITSLNKLINDILPDAMKSKKR
jgi:hypothetical protein